MIPDPERSLRILAPRPGANELSLATGGLRYATTTRYYLAAFQAEDHGYYGWVFRYQW
jgi:hypothetical protein